MPSYIQAIHANQCPPETSPTKAGLSRFIFTNNTSATSANSTAACTISASSKYNPILAAHLGLGQHEVKGPLAQLAQHVNDAEAKKPAKRAKTAANGGKEKIKFPVAKRAKKSGKQAEAGVEEKGTTIDAPPLDVSGEVGPVLRLNLALIQGCSS